MNRDGIINIERIKTQKPIIYNDLGNMINLNTIEKRGIFYIYNGYPYIAYYHEVMSLCIELRHMLRFFDEYNLQYQNEIKRACLQSEDEYILNPILTFYGFLAIKPILKHEIQIIQHDIITNSFIEYFKKKGVLFNYALFYQ